MNRSLFFIKKKIKRKKKKKRKSTSMAASVLQERVFMDGESQVGELDNGFDKAGG